MPTGIYLRTEYHKRKLSEGQKGHVVSEETRKKISMANTKPPKEIRLCACACGSFAKPGKTFITGHNRRNKKHSKESIKLMKRIHTGVHHSKETKEKIRKASTGQKHSEETRTKRSKSMMGKNTGPKPEGFGRKISKALKGKYVGNLSWQWTGGISKLPYAFDFNVELKALIKKRDKHVCQLCQKRKTNKNLCVHHIDYNKQNSDPKNLITLCRSCNSKVNRGRKNWTKFFNQKLKFA